MKLKKFAKLRYNMWFYFIIFSIVLIALVWIFQILLFDTIYQRKKYNSLVETGDSLSQQLNGNDGKVDETTINNWLSTVVSANEGGIFSYLAEENSDGTIAFQSIYTGLFTPNGNNSESNSTASADEISDDRILVYDAINQFKNSSNSDYLCYRYGDESQYDYFVYITTVKNELIGSNGGFLILKSSQQAFIDTIQVIQTQLIVVTICVIVIAFFLSWYISSKLSNPITEISNTAKKWASGDDSVSFYGDSYEEINELADTLNYAKDGISKAGLLQRDLLANVSHDLKTPLTMIKAYAEMIRDLSGNIKEKREQHTKVIIDEADRLTMLVNDILDLSKLQNGVNELKIERVNLSDLTNSVISQFNDFVSSNGYSIEAQITPELFVECDENKMKQVLYNLIGNSINYTGSNKTIMVKLSKTDDKILFESVDTGKGITQENIDTIWEKYYRFSETHHRPVKGTGLGLSIVKTILEAHKLKFGVISKTDVGSNFFIEFKEAKIG